MIHARRGRDSRGHFSNTGRDHEIKTRHGDEFVDDAWRTAIVQSDHLDYVTTCTARAVMLAQSIVAWL